MKIYNASEHWK